MRAAETVPFLCTSTLRSSGGICYGLLASKGLASQAAQVISLLMSGRKSSRAFCHHPGCSCPHCWPPHFFCLSQFCLPSIPQTLKFSPQTPSNSPVLLHDAWSFICSFSQRASSLPARLSKYKGLFPPISCTLGLPVRFQNSHFSSTLNDPGNFSCKNPRGNLSSDQPHLECSSAVCGLTRLDSNSALCASSKW